jgi:iron(III) transport system substrate-binding protein
MQAITLLTMILFLLSGVLGCTAAAPSAPATPPGGTLRILGTADEGYVRGMARAFELETGIKTEYVRQSAGEALGTLKTQRAQPRFSVWWGGSIDGYIAADADGLLTPYQPRGSAQIPRQYKAADGAWTGVWVGALALAVNPRVLAAKGLPEPTSWADLANPIYAGQIALGHPATSGTAYTMLATIMQLHHRDLDAGYAYLQALDRNVVLGRYETSGATTPRIVARGDAAIGVAFSHDIVATIRDGATDLKEVFPTEGTGYEIGGMALLKNGPEPELAKRFLDWALTARAQELGPLFTAYQIPTNPDAKVPEQSVRLSSVKTIDYDFAWAGTNRDTLVDRFSRTVARPPA